MTDQYLRTAYSSAATLTIANANIASSKTAGWQSDGLDFTSPANLIDVLFQAKFAAVNTAPGNTRAIYFHFCPLIDVAGSDYTSSGDGSPSGTEGTITLPDFSTLEVVAPRLGRVPYPVQNKAIVSPVFSLKKACGGIIPPKGVVLMCNDSGMTLNVSWMKIIRIWASIGA